MGVQGDQTDTRVARRRGCISSHLLLYLLPACFKKSSFFPLADTEVPPARIYRPVGYPPRVPFVHFVWLSLFPVNYSSWNIYTFLFCIWHQSPKRSSGVYWALLYFELLRFFPIYIQTGVHCLGFNLIKVSRNLSRNLGSEDNGPRLSYSLQRGKLGVTTKIILSTLFTVRVLSFSLQ